MVACENDCTHLNRVWFLFQDELKLAMRQGNTLLSCIKDQSNKTENHKLNPDEMENQTTVERLVVPVMLYLLGHDTDKACMLSGHLHVLQVWDHFVWKVANLALSDYLLSNEASREHWRCFLWSVKHLLCNVSRHLMLYCELMHGKEVTDMLLVICSRCDWHCRHTFQIFLSCIIDLQ